MAMGGKMEMKRAFELLDGYRRHAEAGASDEWLHAQTMVARTTIRRWRHSRKIQRRPYEAEHGPVRVRMGALDVFKDSEDSGIQLAADSELGGQWRPPQFLLRVPLDYDSLARHLWFLNHELGTEAKALAATFGLQEADVAMAIALYARRLQEVGKLCRTCGSPTEQTYCMPRCDRRKG